MARRPPANNYGDDDDQPWLAEGVREAPATFVPRARLIGGGLVALLLAVLAGLGVYLAVGHKSDGSSGYARAEDAPLITADAGPYKVSPTDPGGAQITGIDDSVAIVAGGADRVSALAPETIEEPLARPGTAGAALPPPTDLLPATIPPAVPLIPPPAKTIVPAPVVAPKVVAPAPVPAKPVAVAALAPAKPVAVATLTNPTPPKLKPKPAPGADPLAPVGKPADPVTRAARFDPAKVDAVTPRPAAPAAAKSETGGSVTLQLGAFSTREKAEAAWSKVGGDGALSGLTRHIEPVERDGKTLYRLRAAGVASKAAATALCGRITGAGSACIVARGA